ncbi:MAG: TetR/AcrR family transcriptional regulator [Solirubrobacteraceae bacterium]
MSGGANDTSPKPKQRRLRAAVRRGHVLDAALALFSERGYRASMDEIAKASGVTRTVLYYYFPSKRELFLAVQERQVTEFLRHVAPAISSRGPAEDRVRTTLDALLGFAESEPRGWDIVFDRSDAHEPDVADVRARTRSMLKATVTALLAEDIERLGLDPDSLQVDLLFDVAVAGIVEGVSWWRRTPSVDRESMLQSLAEPLSRGLVGIEQAAPGAGLTRARPLGARSGDVGRAR